MIPAEAAAATPPVDTLRAIRDGGEFGDLIGFRPEYDRVNGTERKVTGFRVYGTNGIVTIDAASGMCVRATALFALPEF